MFVILSAALLAGTPGVMWTAFPDTDLLALAVPGDVNGNGTEDIVAIPDESTSGLYCVEGLTGDIIWENDQICGLYWAEGLCAVPDIDGDGLDDIAVAPGNGIGPYSTQILTVSSATGEVIWARDPSSYEYVFSAGYALPDSGEAPVIVSCIGGWGNPLIFEGYDGQTGQNCLWSMWLVSSDTGVHPISDYSGNGWGEVGICVDRGGASFGDAYVYDGLTGAMLYNEFLGYDGGIDLADTPAQVIAMRHTYTYDDVLKSVDLVTGDTLYMYGEASWVKSYGIEFARGVQGGDLDFPVLMGWDGDELMLYCGMTGYHGYDPYEFTPYVSEVEAYQRTDTTWKIAVLTSDWLYTVDPVCYGASVEDSCALPGENPGGLAMYSSSACSSAVAGVVMTGGGPGLCAIYTSVPEAVHEVSVPLAEPGLEVVENPARGGLRVRCRTGSAEGIVVDLAGRVQAELSLEKGGEEYVRLPPGMYIVTGPDGAGASGRAVVLP